MNLFKKFQLYFIGGALTKTDDVFEQVKAEVLFNFTLFFLLTNIPYLFVAGNKVIHLTLGISTLCALMLVLVAIKKTNNVKTATYFFLINFTIQDYGHYIINNGRMEQQGLLFTLLFALCGFLLLDRRWGVGIGVLCIAMYMLGLYNLNNNFQVWHISQEISDPPETGNFKFLAIIPLFLNMYLISEFVKARQKAERQLSEQKELIEEKQKEMLDSIRYAKRIQDALITPEKYIEKSLNKLKDKDKASNT